MSTDPALELAFQVLLLGQLVAFGAIRGYYQYKIKKVNAKAVFGKRWNQGAGQEGKTSVILQDLAGLIWGMGVLIYTIYPSAMAWGAISLWSWIRWAGVGIGIGSLPLLIWVHRALGKFWVPTLNIMEDHKIVTTGLYRWIRHPMYGIGFAFMLGTSILTDNWLNLLVTGLTLFVIYARIEQEEQMMIEHFGEDYRRYMILTGRLLPRLIHKRGFEELSEKNKQMEKP